MLSFTFGRNGLDDYFLILAQGVIVILFGWSIWRWISTREQPPGILILWMWMIIAVIGLAFLFPDYARMRMLSDSRELFIPFALSLSSFYLFSATQRQININFFPIACLTVLCAIYILLNSGGFAIADMYREEVNKNQAAPFLIQIGLLAFVYSLQSKKRLLNIIYLMVSFSCLAFVVIVRARTATLGFIAIAFFLFYKRYKSRSIIYLCGIICFVIIFAGDAVLDILQKSIIGNYDADSLDSITTGRSGRVEESTIYVLHHLLFGAVPLSNETALVWNGSYNIPHMYVLWKLVKYGILYGMPFLIMYFAVFVKGMELNHIKTERCRLAVACLGVAYFTSLAEYSSPFGPGSSYIICYIFFGLALRDYRQIKFDNE